MQIVFDDGIDRWEIDVQVNDPGATVADLVARSVSAVGVTVRW